MLYVFKGCGDATPILRSANGCRMVENGAQNFFSHEFVDQKRASHGTGRNKEEGDRLEKGKARRGGGGGKQRKGLRGKERVNQRQRVKGKLES